MRRNKFNSLRRIERLEDRRMMVGDIDFDNGILTITGAGLDDVAEVRFEGNEVVVDLYAGESDGTPDHHDRDEDISDVSKIVFNGFAGNDDVLLYFNGLSAGVSLANIEMEFDGGDGDDDLINQDTHDGSIKTTASGGAGNDRLYGSDFDDVLEGGTGHDGLWGFRGNDTYVFSGTALGVDTIYSEDANVDTDTLDFSNLGHGVFVNLATTFSPSNPQHAVDFAGTLLRLRNGTEIENVIGSAYDDVITGNSRPNHLMGLGGYDNITGAGGNDTLEGGAGSDIYHFAGSNLGTDTIIEAAIADNDGLRFSGMLQGLTIDLTKSGSNYAVNSTDLKLKLANDTAIEKVWGTDYRDKIIGNSRDNYLVGRAGNDEITGGAGADYLHGGDDDDQLWTDALDEAYGSRGFDIFDIYFEGFPDGYAQANPKPGRYMDWRVF